MTDKIVNPKTGKTLFLTKKENDQFEISSAPRQQDPLSPPDFQTPLSTQKSAPFENPFDEILKAARAQQTPKETQQVQPDSIPMTETPKISIEPEEVSSDDSLILTLAKVSMIISGLVMAGFLIYKFIALIF